MNPDMQESTLLKQISQKGSDKEKIANRVVKKPELIAEVVEGLGHNKAALKYGCGKVLRIISQKRPQALYEHIDVFIELLDSDKNIMKWEAIHLIGNLAAVDDEKKIDTILDKYLSPISGPIMITAANVISGAGKIASAKPYLAERIAVELLQVECAKYQTIECRNIALGHAIESFDRFFDYIQDKDKVIELIEKQVTNTRNSTKKKAEIFLMKRQLNPCV